MNGSAEDEIEVGLSRSEAAPMTLPREHGVPWPVTIIAGATLGGIAFAGDELRGVPREVVVYLVSGGFAWGLAALFVGYFHREAVKAMVSASALLIVATLTYYGLILFVSRRWSGGTLDDGSSADAQGLASVGIALTFWLLASVGAGVCLGLLGRTIKHGSPRWASISAGAAFGLLASQGIYFLAITTPFWDPIVHERTYARLAAVFVAASLTIALALISTLVMTRFRQLGRSWGLFTVSALATTGPCVVLWRLVDQVV